MEPSFDWVSILLLVGAANGVVFGATLTVFRDGNRLSNRIFATILFLFSAIIFFSDNVQ